MNNNLKSLDLESLGILMRIYYYFIFILYNVKKTLYYFPVALFISAYILQLLSLEKCYEGFDLCSLKTKWIENKVYEAIISSLILVILIELIFYKIITALNFFHIILFYIIIFSYSHGIDFDDHGYYNIVCSIALILILLLIISPLNCLVYIVKLNNKIYIYIKLFNYFWIISFIFKLLYQLQ